MRNEQAMNISLYFFLGHLYEYVDRESLQLYMNSKQFLKNYMQNYDEFQQSPSTKTLRFECQKAINIPVNAISGINEQHLRDKYERLHNLLIGRSSPNFNSHPQGAAFCKNILALKIVVRNFLYNLHICIKGTCMRAVFKQLKFC